MVDKEDPPSAASSGAMSAFEERAYGLDAGFRLGVEEGEVGMAFKRKGLRVVHEVTCELLREATLTHVFWTEKTVCPGGTRLHARKELSEVGVAAKRGGHIATLP